MELTWDERWTKVYNLKDSDVIDILKVYGMSNPQIIYKLKEYIFDLINDGTIPEEILR